MNHPSRRQLICALALIWVVGLPGAGAADPTPGDVIPGAADAAPGDVITWETRDAVRNLLPEPLHPFTIDNFSQLEMTIVEPQDYPPHPKYVEATSKYSCQAELGSDDQLQNYTAGQPFPHSEWAQDASLPLVLPEGM